MYANNNNSFSYYFVLFAKKIKAYKRCSLDQDIFTYEVTIGDY